MGSADARGRRGPGQRRLSAPENFPEGIHGWDHKHWRTIDPTPFIWAALPAPRPGLWSAHSESQTHAWAAATDLVGRVCWPGRALSPCRTLSLASRPSGQGCSSVSSGQALSGPVGVLRVSGRAGGRPQAEGRARSTRLVGRGAWPRPRARARLARRPRQVPSGLGLLLPDAGVGCSDPPQTFREEFLMVTARSGEPGESR